MADTVIERTFGEKIGGSRYDVWHKGDILTEEDVGEMNDQQRMKNVTKDHIWPKPDYETLEAEGVPPVVLYYRKLVRDSLPAKADSNREDQCKAYLSLVSRAKKETEKAVDLDSMAEVSLSSGWMEQYGFVQRAYGHYYQCTNPYFGTRTLRAVLSGQNAVSLEADRIKKGFLMTKEERILSR